MIETMKFLSITGPKAEIDRVVDTYLSRYEIHLENALSELRSVKNLRAFSDPNPYRDVWQKAQELADLMGPEAPPQKPEAGPPAISVEEAARILEGCSASLDNLMAKRGELEKGMEPLNDSLEKVKPFIGLDYDLRSILHFRYIKFRFGRVPHDYYDKLVTYVYDAIDSVMYKCQEDEEYVWLVYFVPEPISKQIDAIYASMHFEKFFLPDEYEGTPDEAAEGLKRQIESLRTSMEAVDGEIKELLSQNREEISASYSRLAAYMKNYDVRKLAACTRKEDNTYFILCGWMAEQDAKAFQKEMRQEKHTFCIVEDDHENVTSKPPIRLKNFPLFRPFELFLEMYGLPSYHELDPTALIAITYSILFGFMFGDVGQGLCLAVFGYLLYRSKHMKLAAIVSCCGVFSTVFGFLFGSFFGFEDVVPALWLHPKTAMTRLPFIGNLNTVFVVAVAIGMGIILLTMALNIANSIRCREPDSTWFDTNGVAGLVFYLNLVITLLLYMTGHAVPATAFLALMFGLPLLLIFLKEPLMALVEKKSELLPGGKGMFFVQGLFELFEVLLSYFSNTLSFVRVGAFAVSHAAMMEVVLMLAGAEAGESINWLVVVVGNLFVCGMEGLIVGIQVLRLEYYELFSRFYRGSGRAFRPYGSPAGRRERR